MLASLTTHKYPAVGQLLKTQMPNCTLHCHWGGTIKGSFVAVVYIPLGK